MKCPACHSPAISFPAWIRGLNWLRWRCPHCGARLKASRRAIGFLVLCLALMPVYLILLGMISDAAQIEAIWFCPVVFVAVMVPTTVGIGYLAWKTDCYALHEQDAPHAD